MSQAALVTGGAKRLGRSISVAFARKGMDVLVHYGQSEDEAQALCAEIAQLGVRAWPLNADLADRGETERMFQRALELAGRVDVLVNNASIFPANNLFEVTEEDFRINIGINALAPLWISRALAARGGRASIINLLDSRILGPDDAHVAYHVSKRMLFSLTRMMARQFAPDIRVNAVAPGLVLPPDGEDDAYLDRLSKQIPLKRHGSADDVAAAVVFLVESEFITGQVIFVDGGRHLEGDLYG